MTFKGIYRNGVSSRDNPGEIRFEKETVTIVFVDEDGKDSVVVWRKDEICMEENSRPERVALLCEDGKRGSFLFSVDKSDFVFFQKQYMGRMSWKQGIGFILAGGVLFFFFFVGLPFFIDATVDLWSKGEVIAIKVTHKDSNFFLPYTSIRECSQVLQIFVSNYLDIDAGRVYIIDAPYTNAFATIDGKILVTKIFLSLLQTPDELAALLYHEYGHLIKNHPLKMYMRKNIGAFFLMLMAGGHDVSHLLIQTGEEMLVLRYSRFFEKEADNYALKKLAERGWKMHGMEDLLLLLKKIEPSFFWLFSTHPSIEERIEAVRMKKTELSQSNLVFSRLKVERDFRRLKELCTK